MLILLQCEPVREGLDSGWIVSDVGQAAVSDTCSYDVVGVRVDEFLCGVFGGSCYNYFLRCG